MFAFLKRLFHRTPRYRTYQEFLREWNAKQAEDTCLGCGRVTGGECTCDYVDEYAHEDDDVDFTYLCPECGEYYGSCYCQDVWDDLNPYQTQVLDEDDN